MLKNKNKNQKPKNLLVFSWKEFEGVRQVTELSHAGICESRCAHMRACWGCAPWGPRVVCVCVCVNAIKLHLCCHAGK